MINFKHLKSGGKPPADLQKIQQQNLKKLAQQENGVGDIQGQKRVVAGEGNLPEGKSSVSNGNGSREIDRENISEGVNEGVVERVGGGVTKKTLEGSGEGAPAISSPVIGENVREGGKSALVASGQVFEGSDPIIATMYCFGCLRSSIEKLGTPQEVFYCERDMDKDGIIRFVKIKPEITISQCKYRLDDKKPF